MKSIELSKHSLISKERTHQIAPSYLLSLQLYFSILLFKYPSKYSSPQITFYKGAH